VADIKIPLIRRILKANKINAILISGAKNIRYVTGFTGSSGFALITETHALFFTDFRYVEQASKEVEGFEIIKEKGKRNITVKKTVRKLGIKKLGFEQSVSYEFYSGLKDKNILLKPLKNTIEKLRQIKTENELKHIKQAINRAETAFLKVKPEIKTGVAEKRIALRLEEELKKNGCNCLPFDIILASGKNAAMPHARPSEKKIEKGDFVIIDWGGEAEGYFSDMTRTLIINGNGLAEKIKIYDTVNSARKKAIKSINAGIKACDIDKAARSEIEKFGFGAYFGHGTGHGIGLEVHEMPSISKTAKETINEGMVFTVEPGIYIPGLGGVRIEDMAAVQNGKGATLTTLSRELEIIGS
jgi:Xaa-Pro aminopeptidase